MRMSLRWSGLTTTAYPRVCSVALWQCPVRRASRAAIAAGSGLVVAGGEGRRIATKASMGSGRGEEAKLDNELDNYMKVGGRFGMGCEWE